MPSRQFHGKTRHGCKTCKARKVRCDLQRPICQNCTRLSRECAYADNVVPIPSAFPAPTLLGGQATKQGQSDASHRSTSPSSTASGADLELMHYFTAFTCLQMTDNPAHIQIWQVSVPKQAFERPFLLHGILAISALHRRHENPGVNQEADLELARHHQQTALNLYIPLLEEITADSCHALFAFSQIIGAVSYALLTIDKEYLTPIEVIRNVLGLFDLLIGSTVIATQGKDWLRNGELAPMLGHGPAMLDWNMLPISDEPTQALGALAERIARLSPPGDDSPGSSFSFETRKKSYLSAIEKLNPLFPRKPMTVPKISTVIGWPVFLDGAFVALLKQEDEAALVILAYYAVTLHKLKHIWWIDGLGASLLQAVSDVVGQQWAPYLIWPREEVEKNGG